MRIHHMPERGPVLVAEPQGPAPVAAIQLWFRTGSARETAGLHGAAHLLEHMVFKGAGAFGQGELVTRIESLGGDLNAWTSFEQTVLHATVPVAHAGVALEVLTAMGTAPHLDPDELERERGVVLEEIRGSKDDPGSVLADATRARAFGAHAYGRPILGTVESVGAISRDALRAFHKAHYVPDNAILAVAGPVDPEALRADVARLLPSGGAARPVRRLADLPPAFAEPGCFALDPGFDERLVEVSFPVPGHAHPDTAALDLLTVGLGEGGGSQLSQALRHEQDLVLSTWSALESEAAGGMLVLGFAPREGKAEAATRALWEVVERVAREGLPADALRRAKASARADRLRERETVDGRANRLGWYVAAFGDPQAEVHYEAALARVSVGDVRRVAAQTLRRSAALIGAVAPEVELDTRRLEAACAAPRVAPVPVARPAAGIQRATLGPGIEVLMLPDPEAELLGVSVLGVGGAIAEGPRDPGLATAWAAALGRGAGPYKAVELSAVAEERAGGLRAWSARNSFGVRAVFPSAEARTATELLGHMLVAPHFSDEEVARTRADLLELQRSVRDDASELAWDKAWGALYPGHPWGRPSGGTAASAARVTPGRIRAMHRRMVQGRNLVVGVAGGFSPDEIVPLLERTLGGIPEGAALLPRPPAGPGRGGRHLRAGVPRDDSPTSTILAFPSVGHGHPDDPAVQVLSAVLGGVAGGAGRLFDALRERLGLAYSVGCSFERGLGGGALLCTVEADPDRADEALAALWAELDAVVEQGVPDAELAGVRTGLVEGAVLGLQRAGSRAEVIAAAERYGGGAEGWRALLERPRAVTGADLARVARQTLRREHAVAVQVGPGGL
jgi:zinc protease